MLWNLCAARGSEERNENSSRHGGIRSRYDNYLREFSTTRELETPTGDRKCQRYYPSSQLAAPSLGPQGTRDHRFASAPPHFRFRPSGLASADSAQPDAERRPADGLQE